MIFTSFWSKPLPTGMIRIGISRGSPRWMKPGPRIPELAPGSSWFYTATDPEEFRSAYVGQLACVDVSETLDRIERIAQGRPAVLTCFCRPGAVNFCHRSWVSVWLAHRARLDVPEFGMEDAGSGASHPLLPIEYRRASSEPVPLAQLPLF
ncbi:hypothetical protein [Methylobacterium sp. E-046]|uniref:DUF488 family protein, N3 subclade n=1 Tax=Methylobacterium sp. E-046 TaxID=2836576 RepID=UPI003919775A